MKKFLSILLAMLMMVTAFATVAISASAADAAAPTVSKYSGTPDHSWYVDIDATKAATDGKLVKKAGPTYTIASADQFWSFMEISNGLAVIDGKAYTDYENFKDETIKLGIDIVINEGNADDWWKATEYSSKKEGDKVVDTMTKADVKYMWTPISQSHKMEKVTNAPAEEGDQYYHVNIKTNCYFAGTFDGQGHTISGVYSLRGRQNGLFGQVTNGHVKNFACVNSVFYNFGNKYKNDDATPGVEANNQGASQGAGLIERLDGTGASVTNVYTDAYFRGGWCTGGIVAYLQGTDTLIENCVFEGVVDASTGKSGFSGGVLIGGDDNNNKHYIKNCIVAGKLILGLDIMSWQTNPNTDADAKGCGFVMGNWKNTEISDVIITASVEISEGRKDANFSVIGWDNDKGGKANNVIVLKDMTKVDVLNANKAITAEKVKANYTNIFVVDDFTFEYDGEINTVALMSDIGEARLAAAAEKAAADAAAAKAAADKDLADAKADAKAAAEKAAADLEAAKAELAEAKKAADDAATTDEKGGCGAMIATGAILVTVSALGLGYVATKKRED